MKKLREALDALLERRVQRGPSRQDHRPHGHGSGRGLGAEGRGGRGEGQAGEGGGREGEEQALMQAIVKLLVDDEKGGQLGGSM